MKKTLLMVLALALPFMCGNAQEQNKRMFQAVEVEVGGGLGIGLDKMGYERNHLIYSLKGEVRYNFPSGAFDIGLGAQAVRFDRSSPGVMQYDAYVCSPSYQLYLVGDYNKRLNNQMTLFGGLGAGVSFWTQTSAYSISVAPDKLSPYVAPRIGIEAWNRLRFTVSVNIMNKETSFVGFSLGYAFGGKPLNKWK